MYVCYFYLKPPHPLPLKKITSRPGVTALVTALIIRTVYSNTGNNGKHCILQEHRGYIVQCNWISTAANLNNSPSLDFFYLTKVSFSTCRLLYNILQVITKNLTIPIVKQAHSFLYFCSWEASKTAKEI